VFHHQSDGCKCNQILFIRIAPLLTLEAGFDFTLGSVVGKIGKANWQNHLTTKQKETVYIYFHYPPNDDCIVNAFREEVSAAKFVMQNIGYYIGAGIAASTKKTAKKKSVGYFIQQAPMDPNAENEVMPPARQAYPSIPHFLQNPVTIAIHQFESESKELQALKAQLKMEPTLVNAQKAIELYEEFNQYIEGKQPSACHTLQDIKVIS
jgi:hypothetical protein